MEYVNLGNSGLKISKIIVGAMSYGNQEWAKWVKPEEEALPLLKAAFDLGINTWDTAGVYSNGGSEKIIGKAIKRYNIPRAQLVILTKCYFGVSDVAGELMGEVYNSQRWVNRNGLSRKHIFDAVDASVARLGTYIDVLQIHSLITYYRNYRLDQDTPGEEIMKALHDVIQSGKVRYIGASSMYAWEFQMLQNIAEKHGWTKFISMQNYYNLVYREEEREMIPYCKKTGVGIIPWSPLSRGTLARPYDSRTSSREKTDGFLSTQIRARETEADAAIIGRVGDVAKKHGTTMATIAIAWLLSKGASPIIGLGSVERIEEAAKAIKFKLDKKDIAYLEERYLPKAVSGITP